MGNLNKVNYENMGGAKVYEYDFTASAGLTETTATVDFVIKEAWVLSCCSNGFYWNKYDVKTDIFYQYYSPNVTPSNWNTPFNNGVAGITFTVSGGSFKFNTGGVANFNVKNRIVLIGY